MRYARFLAVLCLSVAACRGGDDSLPAPSAGTPVFIISIDTLRSDHLPAYGYQGVATPNLDAFREDAVLYEHAYSHTPLTLPSHSSLLTGTLPAEHGIRDNTGYQLSKKVRTVGEILRENGYVTGAAVSAFVLRRQTGIDRGFDFFDDNVAPLNPLSRTISTMQRDGGDTEQVAAEWLAKQTKPVFFLLHFYEPHMPYSAPEPYKSRYSSGYDAEIARADELVGTFLESLKKQGLYEKSLIILLSDHGEGLGDHGEAEHGTFVYREAIQVPLIVKFPDAKFAGRSVAAPVQLIDVAPTIFERLGIKAPAQLTGRSLASFVVDKQPETRKIYSESWYPRFHYGWSDQHSLIDGKHHYIHSTRAELFDVASDPAEKTNILEKDRRTYFAMKTAIEPLIQQAAAPAAVDPEEVAKLAALGYLGSTVQTRPGEILPDPKDNLQTIADTNEAFRLFSERKYAEAVPVIERLLAANPKNFDVWDLKSKTFSRQGRLEEAVAAAKEGLKLSPNASYLALDVARMQIDLGNLDDAEKHAELALTADPGKAHDLLARVYIGRKDLKRAADEAKKAAAAETSDKIAPLMTFALVQREQGNLEEALRLLNEAIAKRKPREEIQSLFFLRGDVLARMGRAEEAERDFRYEIETFPDDQPAYRNLTILLVAAGRIPEATALIRQLIAEAPVPASYHTVCQVLETVGDVRGVKYWARQGLARFPKDATLRRLAS